MLNKKIKKLLCENSFNWITEPKAWKYFRKSEYYKYLIEDNKERQEQLNECVINYANKFGNDTMFLNLF